MKYARLSGVFLLLGAMSARAQFQYVMGDTAYTYSTQAQPAKGQSYVDSTFHTTITRVTNAATDYGSTGYGVQTNYSTWDPLSSDGQYLLLYGIQSLSPATDDGFRLYNANTYAYIKDLNTWLRGWNAQDPEPRWDRSGNYPHRLYYRKDKQIRSLDVDSGTDALVHDFTSDFPSYGSSYYIYNGQEGTCSRDGRYWAFMLRNASSPYNVALIFVYDMVQNTVASSHAVSSNPDNVGMSPSGNYVYAAYDWRGGGGEFDGPHAYTRDFTSYVHVSSGIPHLSFAWTKQGHEVAVFLDQDYISFTRLDNGYRYNAYYQGDMAKPNDTSTWSGTNLLHSPGSPSKPGWAFMGTYAQNTLGWSYDMIWGLEIDETKCRFWATSTGGTQQSCAGTPRIWQVTFTQNYADLSGGRYYFQQPNPQMDANMTRIWWGANWRNINGKGDVYQVTLPSTWWNDLSGTTTTYSPCDVNKDGLVNSTDVDLAKQAALGTATCTADLDSNGRCDVVDVQRIVNASLGQTCRTGQ
jgi:hypothetical protein